MLQREAPRYQRLSHAHEIRIHGRVFEHDTLSLKPAVEQIDLFKQLQIDFAKFKVVLDDRLNGCLLWILLLDWRLNRSETVCGWRNKTTADQRNQYQTKRIANLERVRHCGE